MPTKGWVLSDALKSVCGDNGCSLLVRKKDREREEERRKQIWLKKAHLRQREDGVVQRYGKFIIRGVEGEMSIKGGWHQNLLGLMPSGVARGHWYLSRGS